MGNHNLTRQNWFGKDPRFPQSRLDFLRGVWIGRIRQAQCLCQADAIAGTPLSEWGRLRLVNLEKQRLAVTQEIYAAFGTAAVSLCNVCGGVCCMEDAHEKFFSLDWWLRRYTDYPLHGFTLVTPRHPVVDALLAAAHVLRLRRMRPVSAGSGPCPELTSRGCSIEKELRPISCVVGSCYALRQRIGPVALQHVSHKIHEMERIAVGVVDVLRKEGNHCYLWGKDRIALAWRVSLLNPKEFWQAPSLAVSQAH